MKIDNRNDMIIDRISPREMLYSCPYLETGSCLALDGVRCCVHGTIHSPLIATKDELANHLITYELIVQRRKNLFLAINGMIEGETYPCKICTNLHKKKYKDICFDYLGGQSISAGINIQHYTACNQRCTYCCYSQINTLVKPQYDILEYLELFREKNKLKKNNWIDFSGGEPTILKEFDKILSYLIQHRLGVIVVYSNAVIFNQNIYHALKKNQIILTTSLDTGIASNYHKLRGTNTFGNVIQNLIKYKNSGTRQLWIKYVICDTNRTDDDLWSFITTALALRPNRIMICPDFPYGEKEIPEATVQFAAKLWHLLERLTGQTPVDYTSDFGDPKWQKYHCDLSQAIQEMRQHEVHDPIASLDKLAGPSLSSMFIASVTNKVHHIWDGDFRKRMLPKGSPLERRLVKLWRKHFGGA